MGGRGGALLRGLARVSVGPDARGGQESGPRCVLRPGSAPMSGAPPGGSRGAAEEAAAESGAGWMWWGLQEGLEGLRAFSLQEKGVADAAVRFSWARLGARLGQRGRRRPRRLFHAKGLRLRKGTADTSEGKEYSFAGHSEQDIKQGSDWESQSGVWIAKHRRDRAGSVPQKTCQLQIRFSFVKTKESLRKGFLTVAFRNSSLAYILEDKETIKSR